MYTVVARDGSATVLQDAAPDGTPRGQPVRVRPEHLPAVVARREAADAPRWVFDRTADWYPAWLRSGVGVARSHDLALCARILTWSQDTAGTGYRADPRIAQRVDGGLDAAAGDPSPQVQDALFDAALAAVPGAQDDAPDVGDLTAELAAQSAAVAGAGHPARVRLLLAAESAGALVGAEMHRAGLPFRADLHDRYLREALGPRVPHGQRPHRLELLAADLRRLLQVPALNPDSPQEVLRALHRAGVDVATTRKRELAEHHHPAIGPLLEYKRLARLHTANGWAWQDAWIRDGRLRPDYVVGGVVTGRWASSGGGALQIPHEIRAAARADPGHRLVVADAAQLEPRVLAAMAGDDALAAAGRGRDLYAGIAERGFGGERIAAKVAMLGAMYGATSGEAGRLLPTLTRAFPRAVGLVEDAARAGETGRQVSTHLGRSCPPADERFRSALAEGRQQAVRARGRFTRNFVVQGTAAEWAMCWLAELRRRLRTAGTGREPAAAELVFFVHDEVVLHVPEPEVEAVVAAVHASAAAASALMFGSTPVEFPVGVTVVDGYDEAK